MSNELPVMEEANPNIDLGDIDHNFEKIERLLNAAARGGPGGSGGEQRARRLAKAMGKVIEDCAGTDRDVVEGAALLMCYAASGGDGYCWARKVLDKDGYKRR